MERQLILNSIQTPDGTILISRHTHDYVEYTDANGLKYSIDGGNSYRRMTIHSDAPYTDLAIYSDAPFEIIRENYFRGGRGRNNDQPLTWVALNKMNDEWLRAAIIYNVERGMDESFANKMYAKEIQYRIKNKITVIEE